MNSPAVDVMQMLADAGIGAPAGQTGWGLFVGEEPAKPNTTITLYDTGGYEPLYSTYTEHPTIQVRVRGDPHKYVPTHAKIQEIKSFLLGGDGFLVGGTTYWFWLQGDVSFLYYDENSRPVFVCNFRLMRG